MKYKCNKCNSKFTSEYLLNKHMNRADPCDVKIQCDRCKTEFQNRFILQSHLNRKKKCIKVSLIDNTKIEIEKEKTRREKEKTKQMEEKTKQLLIQKDTKLQTEDKKTNIPNIPKIQYCYVISNDLNIKHNRYKFGRTVCNQKDLIGCYSRGLPNAQVLLYYETDDYIRDETHVLNHFKEHRISHENRKSEWLQIEFEILKDFLDIYFENNVEEIPVESMDS